MYNEELEKLIELALADGILTEKEKNVLYKKAQLLGIDEDEFEMVLEGKLHIKKQEGAKKKETVLVCPECGETIPPLSFVCPSCSFVLNSASQETHNRSLDDLINNIERSLLEIKAFPSQNIRTLFARVIRKRENEFGRLKGEVEKHIRKAKTLYGENKKVRLLIQELDEELLKVERKRKRSIKINIGIIFVALVSLFCILTIVLREIKNYRLKNPTDDQLMEQVRYCIQNENFNRASEIALKIKNNKSKATRNNALRIIDWAKFNHYIVKNKLDSALALFNSPNVMFLQDDARNDLIQELIKANRMYDAEIVFSGCAGRVYSNYQDRCKFAFLKVFNGYLSKKKFQEARAFILKYSDDYDKEKYLNEIDELIKHK